MPKGCQHGAKIDAQTHQTLMPKLVAKKIWETKIYHVSQIVKSCKSTILSSINKVSQCECANRNLYFLIENEIKTHPQTVSCSKKSCKLHKQLLRMALERERANIKSL